MLERLDGAECSLRPARLLEALRERTADLHTRAERSGIIADILHRRVSRAGYVLMLRNFLPVYHALEERLERQAGSPAVGLIVRPELAPARARPTWRRSPPTGPRSRSCRQPSIMSMRSCGRRMATEVD